MSLETESANIKEYVFAMEKNWVDYLPTVASNTYSIMAYGLLDTEITALKARLTLIKFTKIGL